MLVLDDPAAEQTRKINEALAAASQKYAHPVRLLISNQTVPFDSEFRYSNVERAWMQGGSLADPPPIPLPEAAWFSESETREVALASGLLRHRSAAVQAIAREHLHRVTRGNPLLVELAVEWLLREENLQGITLQTLRKQRIERIFRSLEGTGIHSPSQLAQLALATLIGGGNRQRIEEELSRANLFPALQELPARAHLRACFPTDPLFGDGDAQQVPAVRPELIGDGFIEEILKEIGSERAKRLLLVASQLDPVAILKLFRRGQPLGSSLADALAAVQQAVEGTIAPGEWALAHADLAIFLELDDWFAWTPALQQEREENACAAIDRLDCDQRLSLARALISQLPNLTHEPQPYEVQTHILFSFVNRSLAGDAIVLPAQEWIGFLREMRARAQSWTRPLLGSFEGLERTGRSIAGDFALADELLESALAMGPHWRPCLAGLAMALRPVGGAVDAATRTRRSRLEGLGAILSGKDADSFLQLDARELSEALAGNADLAREVAQNHRFKAIGYSAIIAEEEAAAAIKATNVIAKIADAYQGDVTIRRAHAWAAAVTTVGYARLPQGVGAMKAHEIATQLEGALRKTSMDHETRHAAAYARSSEAFAWANVPSGAAAAQARMAAAATADIVRDGPRSLDLQYEAVDGYRHEAAAWSRVADGRQAALADEAVDKAAALAAEMPGEAVLQADFLIAGKSAAYAWASRCDALGAAMAQKRVEVALSVSRRFPANLAIQEVTAAILNYAAFAWERIPGGEGAQQAREAADGAAQIAEVFASSVEIRRFAAAARRFEGSAWTSRSGAWAAERADKAARALAKLARVGPADIEVNLHAVGACRYAAYAWAMIPDGAQAARTTSMSEMAVVLASDFPEDVPLAQEAALVIAYEIFAWARSPDPAADAKFLRAKQRLTQWAPELSEHPEIASVRSLAEQWAKEGDH